MGSVGQPLADSDAEPGDGFAARSGYWSQVLRWINIPPVPTEDSVSRAAGEGVRILIGTLIANDIDGDFDALSFAGFGPRSANGATVTRDGLSLIYSLPPGGDPGGDDVVTYFVSDGDSPPVAGVLRIIQGTPSNEQQIELDPGLPPRVRLQFRGVPGRAYRLEAAAALQVSWRDLGSFTADSNGRVEFSEVVAAATQFYRWVER